MMPSKGAQRLLLPVNPWFMYGSLCVAMVLAMLPLGRITWLPDFLLLTLVFWSVQQPQYVGVLLAFACGLLMDAHRTTLLGTHALAYSCAAYLAFLLHLRVRLFRLHWQALQMAGVFVAAHALLWVLQLASGGNWPGAGLLLAPLFEALLWPLWALVLLAPQRRALDSDATRPL